MKACHISWAISAGLALTLAAGPAVPAEVRPAVARRAEEFPLSAVRLLDGPFRRAMEVDKAYLLRLDPDRLLAGFRREAGLPKKADPYGGWETIPAEGRWSLAGQGLGHYLSALSMMSSATGDAECRRRVDHIVRELAACQAAAGTGILCAFPESKAIFAELAAGKIESDHLFGLNGGYVPFYVTHKVMAGLRDAWLILGDATARDVLIRLADWLGTVLEKLTDAQILEMLETEHGGILEAVADVYAITGEPRYLALAKRLNHRSLFDPMSRGEDRLNGMHANAQIPKAIGMERVYQLTGDEAYGRAARSFWQFVVRDRSFAIGGHGENEFFFDPAAFESLGVVSRTGPETCNTYNMVKLTRQQWLVEPSGPRADFIERALYNHILASQEPERGGFVYFTSMRPGHYRTYSSDTEDFWCCTDTGMENHAKYGGLIYAHAGDRLWVDLLIPSELDWSERGVRVRLDTRFPEDGRATLTLTMGEPRRLAIAVRRPGWLEAGAMKLEVNGAPEKVETGPDSYAVVERTWKDGDRLEVGWPLAVRTEMLPRSEEWVAVLWGPVVLAGELGLEGLEGLDFRNTHNYVATEALPIDRVPVFAGTPADVASRVRPVPGRPLAFRTEGLALPTEVTLAPFWAVHRQRYAVYWRLVDRAAWETERRRGAGRLAVEPKVSDALRPVWLDRTELSGEIGRRIEDLVYKNWMVIDLERDFLEPFRKRPPAEGWRYIGVGKVIDAGARFAAFTGDPAVRERATRLIEELMATRDPDGYLGHMKAEPDGRQNHVNWILHDQEYALLGLVDDWKHNGAAKSLEHARALGDYILATFPKNPEPEKVCTAGLPEAVLALYGCTGDPRYLRFAADTRHGSELEVETSSLREWEQTFENPKRSHVYVMLARCYSQTLLHRFEPDDRLLKMSRFMLGELVREDGGLLITGSASDKERFAYTQNGAGAIGESCVTAYLIRWLDSLLRLEGDLRLGDVMERTIFNALFAAQDPAGRRLRYFTPFSGTREYFDRDGFCCPGNFRRIVSELPGMVYYRTADGGLCVSLFTPSRVTIGRGPGRGIAISQETDYPSSGSVRISVSPSEEMEFPLHVRIPRWCPKARLAIRDEAPRDVSPGDRSLEIRRAWKPGDSVALEMPMPWRLVRGRKLQEGRVALMRGPVVYCLGTRENAELLKTLKEPADLRIDPASLGDPVPDGSVRPGGLKVSAKAWPPGSDGKGAATLDVVLTEFVDPTGVSTYFRVPDASGAVDDELIGG